MTRRTGLLATTAISALVIGLSGGSQALAADMVTKAPVVVPIGWWMNGYVEIGGRFEFQQNGGGTGGNFRTGPGDPAARLNFGPFPSLGKFNEYRDLREGPFGDLFVAGGSRDGLYQYGFIGKNIGYRDQSYLFDWSQAGVQYLTLGFDQMPHDYNDNATTVFQGAGSNTLTVSPAMRTALAGLLGPANGSGANTTSVATNGIIANTIEGNLNQFKLGFDRYTGSAEYRYTPTDNWDARVDYNITRRDGTQPQGALTYNSVERSGRIVLELPKPVHDETHNANVNVEYNGATSWGSKFNLNLGYGLSLYNDDATSFTFQNPFVAVNGANAPVNNFMSLPPSNVANTFRLNGALDLPMKSRWVVAVNYTHGQQDSDVGPFSINPAAIAAATVAMGASPSITGSTNFQSDAVLLNNVLTTKWTPELSQTSRYRYYSYDSSHAPVSVNYFLLGDSSNVIDAADDNIVSRGISYTKQNAGTDFVWRPHTVRWLTLGAGAGWEQWGRDNRGQYTGIPDVATTNELMGKLFATAKPWEWSQFRASYMHASRRFDGPYMENIGGNQESCNPGSISCVGFRAADLANRDRDKVNLYFDWYARDGLVITPTGGFRLDDYTSGVFLDQTGGGLIHDDSWNAGLEVAWILNRAVTLIGSYTREVGRKELWIPKSSGTANTQFESDMDDRIDTVMVGANFMIIPDKWDLKVAYTWMHATGTMSQSPFATTPLAQFPDQKTTLNRVDVQSKYKVDPWFMQRVGFKGETYLKLRYLWENNDVVDWAADNWNYQYLVNGDTGVNKNLMLGWNNPNYNVHLLMASVGVKW